MSRRDEKVISSTLKLDSDKCYFCGITLEDLNKILQQSREVMKTDLNEFAGKYDEMKENVQDQWGKIEKAFESFDLSIKVNTVKSDPTRLNVPYWDELQAQLTLHDRDSSGMRDFSTKEDVTIGDLLPRLKVSIMGEGEVVVEDPHGPGRFPKIISSTNSKAGRELMILEQNPELANEAEKVVNDILQDKSSFDYLTWKPLRDNSDVEVRKKIEVRERTRAGAVKNKWCQFKMKIGLKVKVPICPICMDRFQVADTYY